MSCIARSFNEQSVAVLSLHVAGNGLDGEKPDGGDLSSVIEDLAIVADQLRISVAAPSIVIGHSSAGATALALASQIPEARAVVAIAIPAATSSQAPQLRLLQKRTVMRSCAEGCSSCIHQRMRW